MSDLPRFMPAFWLQIPTLQIPEVGTRRDGTEWRQQHKVIRKAVPSADPAASPSLCKIWSEKGTKVFSAIFWKSPALSYSAYPVPDNGI